MGDAPRNPFGRRAAAGGLEGPRHGGCLSRKRSGWPSSAAVRHRHNSYDELLMKGVGRTDERESVWPRIEAVLDEWASWE